MTDKTWAIEDHLCRGCGGRVLRCVAGSGPTGGGNPIFKCASCGNSKSGMGPEELCWCGFGHKHNQSGSYNCLPFSILEKRPELKEAFRSCGCEPGKGEVGIVLTKQLREHGEQKWQE